MTTSSGNFCIIVGSYEKVIYGLEFNPISLTLEPAFSTTAHTTCISTIAASNGGKYLASGSTDETVQLFLLKDRKELGALFPMIGEIQALTFSADDKFLFIYGDGREDESSSSENNGNNSNNNKNENKSGVESKGKYESKLAVVRTSDWEILCRINVPRNTIASMTGKRQLFHEQGDFALHPSNKLGVALNGSNAKLAIFDLMSAKALPTSSCPVLGDLFPLQQRDSTPHTVAFNSSGSRLLVASNAKVAVYDPNSMALVSTHVSIDDEGGKPCPMRLKKRIYAATFVLDNSILFAGEDGSRLTLFDAETGKLLAQTENSGHSARIRSLSVIGASSSSNTDYPVFVVSIDTKGLVIIHRICKSENSESIVFESVCSYSTGFRLTCLSNSTI